MNVGGTHQDGLDQLGACKCDAMRYSGVYVYENLVVVGTSQRLPWQRTFSINLTAEQGGGEEYIRIDDFRLDCANRLLTSFRPVVPSPRLRLDEGVGAEERTQRPAFNLFHSKRFQDEFPRGKNDKRTRSRDGVRTRLHTPDSRSN